jgi:hypothetical protein
MEKILIDKKNRFVFLLEKLTKPYIGNNNIVYKPKLTKNELLELVKADPTSRLNNVDINNISEENIQNIKAGKYVNWLIKQFLSITTERSPNDVGYDEEVIRLKEIFFEDLYKVTSDLIKYERFKSRIPIEFSDINKIDINKLSDITFDFDLNLAITTKSERKNMEVHPGAQLVFEGDIWRVVKIEDKGELGKEAACFYGGYNIETSWCTSAPGYNHFEYYINKGPLYVIYKHSDEKIAKKTGLPIERYQFHFEDSQFMDYRDRQIDLKKYLNDEMKELRDYFRPIFINGMVIPDSNRLLVNSLTSGSCGKFISIYGLDELFDSMPDDLEYMEIVDSTGKVLIDLPKNINRFKNLNGIIFDGFVKSIPESLCELTNLKFITLRSNKALKTIPNGIGNMPKLLVLNLKGSNVRLPESVIKNGNKIGENLFDFV